MPFQGQLWYPHQRLHHIKTPSNTPKYKNDIYTRLFLVSNINGPVSLSRIDFRTFFANDLRIFNWIHTVSNALLGFGVLRLTRLTSKVDGRILEFLVQE